MATYFMTWDFRVDNDFIEAAEFESTCKSGESLKTSWSTGVRTNMEIGSELLMVRQGTPPRGIIGVGRCISIPTKQPRHNDPTKDGNYVETEWRFLYEQPVVPEERLPANYRGMRGGGQLAPDDLAKELISIFHNNRTRADYEIDQITPATERQAIIMARRGQGLFRDNVVKTEQKCRLTGIRNVLLLRASHIKPWNRCENGAERLDGHNGLLLCPNADHLFDRGLISFNDDGTLLVSPYLDAGDLSRLGVPFDANVGAFSERQRSYLQFHRLEVFRS